MHPSSENESSSGSSDGWSGDDTGIGASDPFDRSSSLHDSWNDHHLHHHASHHSVIQPLGFRHGRPSTRMPRTPVGWAFWGVGVLGALVAAAVFSSSMDGDGAGRAQRTGPVDESVVRAGAAAACDVPAASVSDPSRWTHGETATPMDDGTMTFYDVPVDDGGTRASASVVLADYGDGWEDAGRECER